MSAYGITVTVLATQLAEAVLKDEAPEEGGFDLSAGMFGAHVSDWIRAMARELDDRATEIARLKAANVAITCVENIMENKMDVLNQQELPTKFQRQVDCVVMLQKYYVRWRHIPSYASMTPLMYISIDHTAVEAKINATEYEIKTAISKEFEFIGIDEISIESIQPM